MYVVKRDGRHEPVAFDKITKRISHLIDGLDTRFIDPSAVTHKVIQGIFPGVTTREIDQLAAETCAYSATYHHDWSILAARIAISDLHKRTVKKFSECIQALYEYRHPKTKEPAPLVSDAIYQIVMDNKDRIDAAVVDSRDFDFDYFGYKTLERSYLLKLHGEVFERPQFMFMRVALGIHFHDIEAALETYDLMSRRLFTHATPTLFNSGTPRPQLSSCFLLTMKGDSIEGIYDTLKSCACISKYAGGIGLSIHNIRSTDSYIRGTNGHSNGIVPMLRVFNDTARYVDQGGNKRRGSFAIYLEPWHADIFAFLDLKKNHGKMENRCLDLFYALWISDLFMERVESDGSWSLFCPNEAPGLADVCGDEFKALYERYEKEGRARKTIRAQALWFAILESQMETGVPFMLYKDAANKKSNQQNLGVIRSSNLCTEIIEYTAPDEIAVCNLASISLPMFVKPSADGEGKCTFDFDALINVTKVITRNLNKVIDVCYYPVEEARKSNMRHRPIGIGVQGLADTFAMMRFPFESAEAAELNRDIFEAIYFASVTASVELAEQHGHYETFPGSPASKGLLQFDLWNVKPTPKYDWASVKDRIIHSGMRNSLLLAPMPTASTAQIMGNNESIEPFTSNIYNRRVLAGEFAVVNKHLLRDLIRINLWTPEMRLRIIADKGSIQNIASIPKEIKDLYKTVWEIKQKVVIDLAADRGAYICQSQSMNVAVADPTIAKLTSMHFYAWKKGLKTGMYYLRTRPKADAIQFTVDQLALAEARDKEKAVCTGFIDMSRSEPSPPGSPEFKGKVEVEPPSPYVPDDKTAGGRISDVDSDNVVRALSSQLSEVAVTTPTKKGARSSSESDADISSPMGPEKSPNTTPSKKKSLEEIALAAAEARRKLREQLLTMEMDDETCISCGS